MQKIIPNLWFDGQAEEAAKFYASLFEHSRIGKRTPARKAGFEIHGQPEGKLMTIEFELEGSDSMGLNGGPIFKVTPAISFSDRLPVEDRGAGLLGAVIRRGKRNGAGNICSAKSTDGRGTADGLSWQVMFMGDLPSLQKITPTPR